ncbi:MAG: hypothetical protein HZA10_05840 [Nitrospirae bacterium]|nr:hypothetical protein [Nitrospirota bacterium]
MKNLNRSQIERQDFVDNAIFNLIKILNPTNTSIDWNIEMIGEVRDVLRNWYVYNLNITKEQKIYPYFEE